eukprot:sb/3463205/
MLSFYSSCTLPQDKPTKREVLGFLKYKQELSGSRVLTKDLKKEIACDLREHFQTIGKLALPENINRALNTLIEGARLRTKAPRGKKKDVFISSLDEIFMKQGWERPIRPKNPAQLFDVLEEEEDTDMEIEDDETKDPSYEAPPEPCTIELKETARICHDMNISNQAGQLIHDAICKDRGYGATVSKTKIYKDKKRAVVNALESLNGRAPVALFFDGKQVDKLIGNYVVKEEQVTLVGYGDWEGFRHLGYSKPIEKFKEKKKLQEKKKDMSTLSPTEFIGPVGKLLKGNVWDRPLVEFRKIGNMEPFPAETVKKLGSDAGYLYNLCIAGKSDPVKVDGKWKFSAPTAMKNLETRVIGPLFHARWLTTAARLMRAYFSLPENDPLYHDVKRVAQYICRIHFPIHMKIKKECRFEDGPTHLLTELKAIREAMFLTKDQKELATSALVNNPWFASPDNVLIGMLASDDRDEREMTVKMIERIRSQPKVPLQHCHKPGLNVKATSTKGEYKGRLCYKTHGGERQLVSEPTLTEGKDLTSYINTPFRSTFLCHSQEVELCVQTSASKATNFRSHDSSIGSAIITTESRRKRREDIEERRIKRRREE